MNKLPWFTHDNDAHEDLFIQEAIEKFGHFGYAGYFMLIEVLDRHGTGDSVTIGTRVLAQKLRSRPGKVRQLLEFCQGSAKVSWEEVGEKLTYSIPKFRKRQANRKSKVLPTSVQSPSKVRIEREREVERDTTSGSKSRPKPKAKPNPNFRVFMDKFLGECEGLEVPGSTPELKAAVSAGYRRFGKAGKDVLAFAGNDPELAMKGVRSIGLWLQEKNLSWTLDTVAKHFPSWKSNPGDFNG